MEAESFSRFLTDDDSRQRYHAPTGTYWMDSSQGISAVFAAAQRAVLPIDSSAEIVVSGPEGFRFLNCRKQQPPLGALLGAYMAKRPSVWAEVPKMSAPTLQLNHLKFLAEQIYRPK